MARIFDQKCTHKECACNRPRAFWVQIDDEGNPSDICWSYYPEDKPQLGEWIEVQEITKKK